MSLVSIYLISHGPRKWGTSIESMTKVMVDEAMVLSLYWYDKEIYATRSTNAKTIPWPGSPLLLSSSQCEDHMTRIMTKIARQATFVMNKARGNMPTIVAIDTSIYYCCLCSIQCKPRSESLNSPNWYWIQVPRG